ncbi:R3H and coiled-coil domain-containing protein 1 [Odontesthes bonariensis]|uniref:R3H and coiled-coil domain-containing protein 1 n=1 Tax=Odontesthes bonariensis TaxID=219752 RepID=UPI003F586147
MDELEAYQQRSDGKSVLLFPPLPSRLRYLIHKTIEDLPELTTFSVGESWCRRVVICHSELRGESEEEDSDFENNSFSCEEFPSGRAGMESNIKPKPSIPSRSRGAKRPDKPLYMPRAAREKLSLQSSQSPTAYTDSTASAPSSSNSTSCPANSCPSSETTETPTYSSSYADGITDTSANISAPCPREKTQMLALRLHESEAHAWEQTQCCFAEMNLEDERQDLASVQYGVQTEDTTTGTDDVTELIKAHLKQAEAVSIEHVHNDFSVYESVSLNSDDFRHVIEIYDFPAVLKTDDLFDAFTEYSDGGMKIKWVDNTHALGVFSSEAAAIHALSISHPLLKARALSEGSKKAQGKALRRAEFIQPVKERPRTDSAVARRMVTRALGLRGRGRALRY